MNAPLKIAGFIIGLAALFAAALGVGHLVGPITDPPAEHDDVHGTEPVIAIPGGLMTSQDGYTLSLRDTQLDPGRAELGFRILGPDGHPVTTYDEQHEKRLHLIVVRRDFTGFQHVHPELDGDGTWTVPVDLAPGQWRVFADFKATGAAGLTLGADLAVPGDVPAVEEMPVTRVAELDSYTVELAGDLSAGEHSMLTLSVSKDGRPVTDLQPYLGAYGHLVALRAGDLAYLHVHPDASTEAGPDVRFGAEVPSPGDYHLYLDFKHDGVVRTAEFKVSTTGHGH